LIVLIAALSTVHRFHDDRLDMPLMDKNDYYWRNRIMVVHNKVPDLKVFIHYSCFFSSNHGDMIVVFSNVPRRL